MRKEFNRAIELARDVNTIDEISQLPLNFDSIFNQYGIKYKETNMNEFLSESNLKNASGCIYEKNGEYVIVVEENDPIYRKRFTIAHELGHFFMHRNRLITNAFVTTEEEKIETKFLARSGYNFEEQEANHFAAELLMPERLIREFVSIFGLNKSILHKLFGVSLDAMNVRLSNLGY